MIRDEEYLERLVAGIHSATSDDADVRWNETINGRQFDVVVRFQVGTLRYLVLVEVKNRKRPASASDLEAFVVKANDQQANKSVFVTAAGFQEGAKTVAQRHGVDIFTIAFDLTEATIPSAAALLVRRNPKASPDMVPEFSIGDPEPVATVQSFSVIYDDGTVASIPNEPSQMTYYMQRTKIEDGRFLTNVVEEQPIYQLADGQVITFQESFSHATLMTPPDEYFFPKGRVKKMSWEVFGEKRRPILGNIRIDPSLFAGRVVYTNALSGEMLKFGFDQLPLGSRDVIPGQYYFLYHPLIYYRCESIDGDTVVWTLVESFQSGELMRARFTQDIMYAQSYIPVSDKLIISRLERRLADYEALVARDARRGAT